MLANCKPVRIFSWRHMHGRISGGRHSSSASFGISCGDANLGLPSAALSVSRSTLDLVPAPGMHLEHPEINHQNHHSFIHHKDLWSTSSRLIPRSAPNPSMAKRTVLRLRVEQVRMDLGEQSQCHYCPFMACVIMWQNKFQLGFHVFEQTDQNIWNPSRNLFCHIKTQAKHKPNTQNEW